MAELDIEIRTAGDVTREEVGAGLLALGIEHFGDLETFEKAVRRSDEHNIWSPHANENLAAAEELNYAEFADRLEDVQNAVMRRFHLARKDRPLAKAKVPEQPVFGEDYLALSKLWRSTLDEILATFLPPDVYADIGRVNTYRSYMAQLLNEGLAKGEVGEVSPKEAERELRAIRNKRARAFYQACAEYTGNWITAETTEIRTGITNTLIAAYRSQMPEHRLTSLLYERFGFWSRDWRRLVLTENQIAATNGFLLRTDEGEYITFDKIPGSCEWCKANLEGKIFRVTHTARADDAITDDPHGAVAWIWPGKSNVGRSASPKTRGGREREAGEQWWACSPAHPNCRHHPKKFHPDKEVIIEGEAVPKGFEAIARQYAGE